MTGLQTPPAWARRHPRPRPLTSGNADSRATSGAGGPSPCAGSGWFPRKSGWIVERRAVHAGRWRAAGSGVSTDQHVFDRSAAGSPRPPLQVEPADGSGQGGASRPPSHGLWMTASTAVSTSLAQRTDGAQRSRFWPPSWIIAARIASSTCSRPSPVPSARAALEARAATSAAASAAGAAAIRPRSLFAPRAQGLG